MGSAASLYSRLYPGPRFRYLAAVPDLFHQTARDFVPHNAQITIKTPDIEDTDWADLAIFPLERSLYVDELFQDQRPYRLAANLGWISAATVI